MKKLIIMSALLIFGVSGAFAQNHMIVNTETILKAIPEYTAAVEEMDRLAQQYQSNIDEAYARIEEMYNTYMAQKGSLSQMQQQNQEQTILNNEQKVLEYQDSVFGSDGIIDKKRAETLEPIQKRVVDVITGYAERNNFALVLDVATNPMVVYYSPAMDKTQEIISLLK